MQVIPKATRYTNPTQYRLSADVFHPDTQEVLFEKGRTVNTHDIEHMLELGIESCPLYINHLY